MKRPTPHRDTVGGFTLVELIIVIIILGILAAMALPQFTTSTDDAKLTVLKNTLANTRKVIQRYYHEHNSTYPGAVQTDGSGLATVDADSAKTAFRKQMYQYSKRNGETKRTKNADFPLGPYFEDKVINPVSGKDVLEIVLTYAPIDAGDINNNKGWIYSPYTGEFRANILGYETY